AGASLAGVIGPIVAKHGGGVLARLKANWGAIVGPHIATACWPGAVAPGGTLRLRGAPAQALGIPHRTPLLLGRINLFFGREAIGRMTLIQGSLPLNEKPAASRPRQIAAGEAAALDHQLSEIDDRELREALDRLGRAVIGSET